MEQYDQIHISFHKEFIQPGKRNYCHNSKTKVDVHITRDGSMLKHRRTALGSIQRSKNGTIFILIN